MTAAAARLPRRFPAGTKFVVEGEDAADGRMRVVARYLVYPDGTRVNLLAGAPRLFGCFAQRRTAGRTRRMVRHREDRPALQ